MLITWLVKVIMRLGRNNSAAAQQNMLIAGGSRVGWNDEKIPRQVAKCGSWTERNILQPDSWQLETVRQDVCCYNNAVLSFYSPTVECLHYSNAAITISQLMAALPRQNCWDDPPAHPQHPTPAADVTEIHIFISNVQDIRQETVPTSHRMPNWVDVLPMLLYVWSHWRQKIISECTGPISVNFQNRYTYGWA